MPTTQFQLKTGVTTPEQLEKVCTELLDHYRAFVGFKVVSGRLLLYTSILKDVKGITPLPRLIAKPDLLAVFLMEKLATTPEPPKPAKDIPLKLGWRLFTPTDAGGSLETPLEYAFAATRQWMVEEPEASTAQRA